MAPGERPDRELLERVAATLDHRGPDDRGIEVHENVGLVATRLAIVDPGPSGHQPMWDASGRCLLAFNGEVYNHRELRDDLPGVAWRGHGDTETLAAALAAWGEDAVGRTNGPLALAAVDRERRRLMLARDRFGKKPLYVARHRGALWFASEMRALLAAGVARDVRPDVLAHTALRGWALGTETPFAAIDRLAPGTLLSVGLDAPEAVSVSRWYTPADSVDPELGRELAALPRERQTDRLEDALRASVRARLMADVPVGTMLSGGLDSTLVTALAREAHGAVTAVTCALVDEPRADERRWAERAATALGVDLDAVVVTADTWRSELVTATSAHEYPLNGSSSVPVSLMARRAHERGVPVLLTGEGADELMAGYPLEHARAELRYLPWRVIARRYGSAVAHRRLGPRSITRSIRGLSHPVPAAAAATRESAAVRALGTGAYAHHDAARRRFEGALLAGMPLSLGFLLNRMDKNAMTASIETRVPFLDPGVVSVAVNLPLEARTQPLLKGVLRDVGRRHLPPALADRPKLPGMFFDGHRRIAEAARPGFLADGMLRDLLGRTEDEWRALGTGLRPRQAMRLWTAEIWARLFVEGHPVERVERELWAA